MVPEAIDRRRCHPGHNKDVHSSIVVLVSHHRPSVHLVTDIRLPAAGLQDSGDYLGLHEGLRGRVVKAGDTVNYNRPKLT